MAAEYKAKIYLRQILTNQKMKGLGLDHKYHNKNYKYYILIIICVSLYMIIVNKWIEYRGSKGLIIWLKLECLIVDLWMSTCLFVDLALLIS